VSVNTTNLTSSKELSREERVNKKQKGNTSGSGGGLIKAMRNKDAAARKRAA